jgi:hypothetical protein
MNGNIPQFMNKMFRPLCAELAVFAVLGFALLSNTAGSAFGASLTTNTIQVAQYRIDGGAIHSLDSVSTVTRTEYREQTFQTDLTTSGLSVGSHWLETRMQSLNGIWCAWQGRWIRVTGETHLVAAEWFIDTDPGPGLATSITLPLDGAWDEPEEEFEAPNVDSSSLATGYHTLFIRCKDSNGDWGITNQTTFYVGPPLFVARAEWTTDTLSAAGTGHAMEAVDGSFDEAEEDLIFTGNSSLLNGAIGTTTTLYVRVQDSLGRWSTRGGLMWDPVAEQWTFSPDLGWKPGSFAEGLNVLHANPAKTENWEIYR